MIASVNSPDNDTLPIINFKINGLNVRALCDSGVAVRLLSPDFFSKLKKSNVHFKYLDNRVKIKTLTNSTISFKQCMKLAFGLESVFTMGSFYITNQLLSGYDCLKMKMLM